MRGSCWLSVLLSVSYPDAISISFTLGKAQALFFTLVVAAEASGGRRRYRRYRETAPLRKAQDSALGDPGSGDHACNRFWNRLCSSHSNSSRLYEVVDEFGPGARRSGALSREGCVRNVLRDTVMACRKPPEQSLARCVLYPWVAEMPKGGLQSL